MGFRLKIGLSGFGVVGLLLYKLRKGITGLSLVRGVSKDLGCFWVSALCFGCRFFFFSSGFGVFRFKVQGSAWPNH